MTAVRPPDRSSGTYLLVVGAVVIAVCVTVLGFLATIAPAIALPVLAADVLLLAAMAIVRLTVRRTARRQWTMTAFLLAASVLSLSTVVLIGSLA